MSGECKRTDRLQQQKIDPVGLNNFWYKVNKIIQ